MAWKIQNIVTNILSPLLFIGMIVAYVYSELSKVANIFFYILLIGTIISNIAGAILNIIELNNTRKHSSKSAFIAMVMMTLVQALLAILIIFTMVSQV